LWEAVTAINADSYSATPPHRVLSVFISGLSGPFWPAILASLKRILIGFSLALIIGGCAGAGIASSRKIEWLLGPVIPGIQSLPSICWLPVSILWFGLNEKAILFVVLMGSVGSITIAARDGLKLIPQVFHRIGDTYGANAWQKLFLISLPAALPSFVSGIKQGWSFAWRSLMAGELLYHSKSLGSLLSDSRDLADYPQMYAVMLLVIAVSLTIDKTVFTPLDNLVKARWGIGK
jgi:NitT/TauT family transport system permease protein